MTHFSKRRIQQKAHLLKDTLPKRHISQKAYYSKGLLPTSVKYTYGKRQILKKVHSAKGTFAYEAHFPKRHISQKPHSQGTFTKGTFGKRHIYLKDTFRTFFAFSKMCLLRNVKNNSHSAKTLRNVPFIKCAFY